MGANFAKHIPNILCMYDIAWSLCVLEKCVAFGLDYLSLSFALIWFGRTLDFIWATDSTIQHRNRNNTQIAFVVGGKGRLLKHTQTHTSCVPCGICGESRMRGSRSWWRQLDDNSDAVIAAPDAPHPHYHHHHPFSLNYLLLRRSSYCVFGVMYLVCVCGDHHAKQFELNRWTWIDEINFISFLVFSLAHSFCLRLYAFRFLKFCWVTPEAIK